MRAFEKWWPYLRDEKRKIVEVRFDDGSTLQTDEDELREYLKCRDARRLDDECRRLGLPPLKEVQAMHTAYRSVQAGDSAKNPRNPFARSPTAKAELLAFLDQYEKDEGKSHGGMTAAAAKFLCDVGTLKTILARKAD